MQDQNSSKEQKTCTKCGKLKHIFEYHFANKNKDLRQCRCKSCVLDYLREYSDKNKARISESNRQRYKKIATEKINGKFTSLFKTCPRCNEEKRYDLFGLKKGRTDSCNKSIRHICLSCDKEVKSVAYQKNRVAILDSLRNRSPDEKKAHSLRIQIYKNIKPTQYKNTKRNSEKKRVQRLIEQSDGTLTKKVLANLYKQAISCPDCNRMFSGLVKKSLDHIKPISKGGLHSASNVRICCLACNIRKGANDS
jgi:hypothetical protein